MAEENKQNPNGEVFIGSVEKTSGDKKSEVFAKEPRRLFEFWKKFQTKQEEAFKRAGISSAASKISTVRLVTLKSGKEAVKVDFVGGGGVIDAGNKAHIFRRVNRNLPSPSKIRMLLAAIREKGWDAVAADLDPATREVLLKACSSAGVKLEKSSASKKSEALARAQLKSAPTAAKAPEYLIGKPATPGLDVLIGAVAASKAAEDAAPSLSPQEIEEMKVADALIFAGMREEAVEALWRGGSKPSARRDSGMKARRKTTNAVLMQNRREESRLVSEIKQGYKDIMAAVRKDIIKEQLESWRSEYYGTEDKPGLKDTIAQKRAEGKNLTAREAKLAERIERFGIRAKAEEENLSPDQEKARIEMKMADLDSSYASKYRETKKRKSAIRDEKLMAVRLSSSELSLKALTSPKTLKFSENAIKDRAAAMVSKGKSTEEIQAHVNKMRKRQNKAAEQVKRAKEARKAAPKANQALKVSEKIKETSEKLETRGKKKQQSSQKPRVSRRKSFHDHLVEQERSSLNEGAPLKETQAVRSSVSEPAPSVQEQKASVPHPLRGAALTKFILDQKAASR